ncbi:MAG: hypothetical protein ACRDD1_01785, partial [Planctomycetia bacterium]
MLLRKQRLAVLADTVDDIRRAVAWGEEFRIALAIVGGAEAGGIAPLLRDQDVPVFVRLDHLVDGPVSADGIARSLEGAPQRVVLDERRRRRARFETVGRLHAAGVPVALCLGDLKPEDWPTVWAGLKSEGGVANDLLLDLSTSAPAKLLGVENVLGGVAPGRSAHLVVRAGGPIDPLSTVETVFVGMNRFVVAPSVEKAKPPLDAAFPPVVGLGELDEAALADAELDADRRPLRRTEGNVLLRNATVWTATAPDPLPRTDVLVRDGKIVEIGSNLNANDQSVVIDLTGRFVMPGLVDVDADLGLAPRLREPEAPASTADVRVRDVLRSSDPLWYDAVSAGVTTARVPPTVRPSADGDSSGA